MGAYLWWGFVVIYFKQVAHVPATEILAHRIVWSVVLLSVLMRIYGRWHMVAKVLASRRTVLTLCATTILIAVNWLVFIWAVTHDLVLEASLGYFINPLLNVLLGYVFLRERLRQWQMAGVALAAVGVIYLTLGGGSIPWVALALAGSFGLYGLLRKTAKVDALVGLTVEVLALLPLALAYLTYLAVRGQCVFGSESIRTDVLLAMGGLITAIPLLWFTNAARRLRLSTMGFLQFIAPSLQFLLAVAVYGEDFTPAYRIAFGCIWTALIIYSVDTARSLAATGRSTASRVAR